MIDVSVHVHDDNKQSIMSVVFKDEGLHLHLRKAEAEKLRDDLTAMLGEAKPKAKSVQE